MITEREIIKAKKDLEKLGFAPLISLAKGSGRLLWGGVKGVGKGIGEAAKLTNAARFSPAEGAIGAGFTGLAGLGLLASASSPVTGGLSQKALDSIPLVGPTAGFFNPYTQLTNMGESLAPTYEALGQLTNRRTGQKLNNFDPKSGSFSRHLVNANSPSANNINYNQQLQKSAGATMFSSNDIKRYYQIKNKLEKTASVSKLRKSIQSAKSDDGNSFARQALAYMAGATALGVGAPLIANAVGEGMSFARRGRLNRDYNEMIKQDPELRGDPQARQYFELLHRSSPYVAQEPVIAATVVRNLVDSPALDGRKFKDILDIERARQDTKHPMMKDPSNMSKLMKIQTFGE